MLIGNLNWTGVYDKCCCESNIPRIRVDEIELCA